MTENKTAGQMVRHFRDLRVYQAAMDAAMKIFELTKTWPAEERFSIIDQVRRSSRSVCACISEAWRKRRYPAHFASKLSDADSEAAETQTWLECASRCEYLSSSDFEELDAEYNRICGSLVRMMDGAETWCGPSQCREESAEYTAAPPHAHTPIPPYSHTPKPPHAQTPTPPHPLSLEVL